MVVDLAITGQSMAFVTYLTVAEQMNIQWKWAVNLLKNLKHILTVTEQKKTNGF